MPRYRFTIEYHGGPFVGWQRQASGLSVQGALERALAALDEPATVTGAGRTDSGVHALGQVAHADLAREWDPFRLSEALSYHLKPDPAAVKLYVRGGTLTPLPGTREEVQAVGDVVLLGEDANEAKFREAIAAQERWRAVHMACHGLVDPERPTLSSLALTRAGSEDGFLTAQEVLRMEIPADLAVLSACETARGKIVKGEGIVGPLP